jgi:hypothetical protein
MTVPRAVRRSRPRASLPVAMAVILIVTGCGQAITDSPLVIALVGERLPSTQRNRQLNHSPAPEPRHRRPDRDDRRATRR